MVDRWADYIRSRISSRGVLLSPDTRSCWTQFAYHQLADVRFENNACLMDIRRVKTMPEIVRNNGFVIRIDGAGNAGITIKGGAARPAGKDKNGRLLEIIPEKDAESIMLVFQ